MVQMYESDPLAIAAATVTEHASAMGRERCRSAILELAGGLCQAVGEDGKADPWLQDRLDDLSDHVGMLGLPGVLRASYTVSTDAVLGASHFSGDDNDPEGLDVRAHLVNALRDGMVLGGYRPRAARALIATHMRNQLAESIQKTSYAALGNAEVLAEIAWRSRVVRARDVWFVTKEFAKGTLAERREQRLKTTS